MMTRSIETGAGRVCGRGIDWVARARSVRDIYIKRDGGAAGTRCQLSVRACSFG